VSCRFEADVGVECVWVNPWGGSSPNCSELSSVDEPFDGPLRDAKDARDLDIREKRGWARRRLGAHRSELGSHGLTDDLGDEPEKSADE
jgi:hypothetical protein